MVREGVGKGFDLKISFIVVSAGQTEAEAVFLLCSWSSSLKTAYHCRVNTGFSLLQ
jgi:hypothetical protein